MEIQLQPLPGNLAGLVTDAAIGTPVTGATVALGQWSTQTDAGGRYTLAGLTPGAYTLQISVAGYQSYEASVAIGPGASVVADAALPPQRATLTVTVVDATTGGPIAGATIGYGPVAGQAGSAPCADVALLVPLKRSAEFAAIRRRVADHHLDAWQEDGLHFFVFRLHPAEAGGLGPPGANGAGAGSPVTQAPLAVFAMNPETAAPHSAVVVTPGPDGADAEIMDLRAPDQVYTAPVA